MKTLSQSHTRDAQGSQFSYCGHTTKSYIAEGERFGGKVGGVWKLLIGRL